MLINLSTLQSTISNLLDHLTVGSHQDPTVAFNQMNLLLYHLLSTPDHAALVESYLNLQDRNEFNLASHLLDFIASSRSHPLDHRALATLIQAIKLLQGSILLHKPSQHRFNKIDNLNILLNLLHLSLPSPMSTPTSTLESLKSTLSLNILDALLCALVDQPQNMRTFEAASGLKVVVQILKDKNVVKVVRIKAIEILYYYLLPETTLFPTSLPPTTPTLPSSPPLVTLSPRPPSLHHLALSPSTSTRSLLSSTLSDFIPQTPIKRRSPALGSSLLSPSLLSRSRSYTNSPSTKLDRSEGVNRRRSVVHDPGRFGLSSPCRLTTSASIIGSEPRRRTAVDYSRAREGKENAPVGSMAAVDQPVASTKLPPAPYKLTRVPVPSLHPPPPPPTLSIDIPPITLRQNTAVEQGTRSDHDKRELLRREMENIEALEKFCSSMRMFDSRALVPI